MAGLLRQAAGQHLTDGWCGWIARRYLAAGWSAAELGEVLARIPPRREWPEWLWDYGRRDALLVCLAREQTFARHWADPWQAVRPAPQRVRRAAVLAERRENARRTAAVAAARAAGLSAAGRSAAAAAMAAAAAARGEAWRR
jgi:hypothetical protein